MAVIVQHKSVALHLRKSVYHYIVLLIHVWQFYTTLETSLGNTKGTTLLYLKLPELGHCVIAIINIHPVVDVDYILSKWLELE